MRIKNDDLIKMCVLGTLPEGVSIIFPERATWFTTKLI